MTAKIDINGFGRIDRLTLRRIMDSDEKSSDIEIATVNDLTTPALLAHLLKYDSTHGTFSHEVSATDNSVVADGKKYRVYAEPQAQSIPWVRDGGADFVLECTGFYTSETKSEAYLKAGAKRVLISAPTGLGLKTIAYSINDDILTANDEVVPAGLCTTNLLTPVVNALQKEFDIEVGTMTTIHVYTSTQMLLGGPVHGGNLRFACAAAISIIPHSAGAAKAIGLVVPELNGKLNGHAQRVPAPDGSVTELVSILNKGMTTDEVNETVKKYESPPFAYNDHNIISNDVLGMTAGSIFDPTQAMVTTASDKQLIKTVTWYDSEYSFTCQVAHTLLKFATL